MKVETRISTIEQLENSIIRVGIKSNIQLELADLDENFKVYKQILGNEKGLFLIVFEPNGESSAETRAKFANTERSKIKKAEALVIETLAHRIESNFYKKHFKPNHPVKLFSKESDAIKWLLSIA